MPEKTWLAAHLYYAGDYRDFLTQAVKPFVESVLAHGLADQFFFVRYRERGPHIRLRFKGDSAVLAQQLRPRLSSYFLRFFASHASRRRVPEAAAHLPEAERWFPNDTVQYLAYEPEIDRYAGPVGLRLAERQFEASSQAVLSVMDEADSWTYDQALGVAIQLHLGFAHAVGMTREVAIHFFGFLARLWAALGTGYVLDHLAGNGSDAEGSQQDPDTIWRAFAENFDRQSAVLIPYHAALWDSLEQGRAFDQEWFNTWITQTRRLAAQLRQAQQDDELVFPVYWSVEVEHPAPVAERALWNVLHSYVHMTNNRLGINNYDEAYVGYLIEASLAALSSSHQPTMPSRS